MYYYISLRCTNNSLMFIAGNLTHLTPSVPPTGEQAANNSKYGCRRFADPCARGVVRMIKHVPCLRNLLVTSIPGRKINAL